MNDKNKSRLRIFALIVGGAVSGSMASDYYQEHDRELVCTIDAHKRDGGASELVMISRYKTLPFAGRVIASANFDMMRQNPDIPNTLTGYGAINYTSDEFRGAAMLGLVHFTKDEGKCTVQAVNPSGKVNKTGQMVEMRYSEFHTYQFN